MIDQAARLRQIVNNMKEARKVKDAHGSKIIAITSGKGGVGKTTFTLNLALTLREQGLSVLIIDADFGLSNIDVMMGIIPKYNLSHVILRQKELKDIISEGPNGILFISGGAGIQELVRINGDQLNDFIKQFQILEELADVILIDTGAGLSESVIRMVLAAQETILLITPEPTAITDAYTLLKMTLEINREVKFRLVINKTENKHEAEEILTKFIEVTEKFLKIRLKKIGFINYDTMVLRSVKIQQPFLLQHPGSLLAKQFHGIAKEIMSEQQCESTDRTISGFVSRFVQFIKFKG